MTKNPIHTNAINILYEDPSILVCVKPRGVATQSKRSGTPDMVSLLKNHIYHNSPKKDEPYLAVIHRLDQPVKGILVFAKSLFAAKELNRQLQNQEFGKYYHALVDGHPPKSAGTLEDYIIKDTRTNTSKICSANTKDAKIARLHYTIIKEGQGHFKMGHDDFNWGRGKMKIPPSPTELEIHLETGRHHQIRVQLANAGCPIVGDTKYNPRFKHSDEWQEIQLYAYKLEFRHPENHKIMRFQLS